MRRPARRRRLAAAAAAVTAFALLLPGAASALTVKAFYIRDANPDQIRFVVKWCSSGTVGTQYKFVARIWKGNRIIRKKTFWDKQEWRCQVDTYTFSAAALSLREGKYEGQVRIETRSGSWWRTAARPFWVVYPD